MCVPLQWKFIRHIYSKFYLFSIVFIQDIHSERWNTVRLYEKKEFTFNEWDTMHIWLYE